MEIQLQELIDQIKKDGVEAAETQAEAILTAAKAEAEKIIKNSYPNCIIETSMYAFDADMNVLGYVLKVISTDGYSGNISFLVGIKLDGGFQLNPLKKVSNQALGGKLLTGAAVAGGGLAAQFRLQRRTSGGRVFATIQSRRSHHSKDDRMVCRPLRNDGERGSAPARTLANQSQRVARIGRAARTFAERRQVPLLSGDVLSHPALHCRTACQGAFPRGE